MLAEVDQRHVQTSMARCPNGMDAFLALPQRAGSHPTVVLLHERYGLVQHTRDLAVRFAAEGYLAIAPNLYWREPNQEKIARGDARADAPDRQVCEDVAAACEQLRAVPAADLARLVIMGVCATGRHPLVFAADRPEVSACVVFYGAAYRHEWEPTDTLSSFIAKSSAPVLGVFGELDNLMSLDDVLRLRAALETARRSYHIKIFPDAPHGFLNDTMPGRYRRPQAEAAWRLLMDFLARVHSGGYAADRVQWAFESDSNADYDFSTHVRWS